MLDQPVIDVRPPEWTAPAELVSKKAGRTTNAPRSSACVATVSKKSEDASELQDRPHDDVQKSDEVMAFSLQSPRPIRLGRVHSCRPAVSAKLPKGKSRPSTAFYVLYGFPRPITVRSPKITRRGTGSVFLLTVFHGRVWRKHDFSRPSTLLYGRSRSFTDSIPRQSTSFDVQLYVNARYSTPFLVLSSRPFTVFHGILLALLIALYQSIAMDSLQLRRPVNPLLRSPS